VRPSRMTFGVIKRYAGDRKTEVLWIKGELRWIPLPEHSALDH
jgi:hypothetical protein